MKKFISNSEKNKYFSPELEIIQIKLSEDILGSSQEPTYTEETLQPQTLPPIDDEIPD